MVFVDRLPVRYQAQSRVPDFGSSVLWCTHRQDNVTQFSLSAGNFRQGDDGCQWDTHPEVCCRKIVHTPIWRLTVSTVSIPLMSKTWSRFFDSKRFELRNRQVAECLSFLSFLDVTECVHFHLGCLLNPISSSFSTLPLPCFIQRLVHYVQGAGHARRLHRNRSVISMSSWDQSK